LPEADSTESANFHSLAVEGILFMASAHSRKYVPKDTCINEIDSGINVSLVYHKITDIFCTVFVRKSILWLGYAFIVTTRHAFFSRINRFSIHWNRKRSMNKGANWISGSAMRRKNEPCMCTSSRRKIWQSGTLQVNKELPYKPFL
jgi:hypothetical protein